MTINTKDYDSLDYWSDIIKFDVSCSCDLAFDAFEKELNEVAKELAKKYGVELDGQEY